MTKQTWRISLFWLILFSHSVLADVEADKKSAISELLTQYGQSDYDVSHRLIENYIEQIRPILRSSYPDITPTMQEHIEQEVSDIVEREVIENQRYSTQLTQIYSDYFSLDELRAIIEFNQTELGKKILRIRPLIEIEADSIMRELELDLAPEINQRLLDIIAQPQDN